MPIDPRLFAGPDMGAAYARGLQIHEHREDRENKRRLADLLPQAVHGDRSAIDQIAGIDPEMFMKLDDRQRQQANAEVADLSAAVKWADTPEKWQYVQQHYGQHGVDLSPYRFEDRERGLVALGQIGSYLKGDGNPTNMEREYQFLHGKDPKLADQFLHNRAEGSPLVANNGDGTFTIIPRGYSGGAAPNGPPQPGQVVSGYRYKGGDPNDQNSWEAVGGPSPGGSGGFLQSREQ